MTKSVLPSYLNFVPYKKYQLVAVYHSQNSTLNLTTVFPLKNINSHGFHRNMFIVLNVSFLNT